MNPHRRAARTSVRLRAAAAGMAVVTVALVVAAAVVVLVVRSSLSRGIQRSAVLRAEDVEALLQAGATPSSLAIDDEDGSVLQVVDGHGRVLASSPNIEGEPALLPPSAPVGQRVDAVPVGEESFLVVVVEATGPSRRTARVISGQSLAPVTETTRSLLAVASVGLPLLVLVVGLTIHRLTGSALSPVEAIRARVAAIGADRLYERVPVPPTDDEIGRLAVTMNAMLERLEAAQVEQRRFVADASHELRSPLAAIRQLSEVAVAHPDRLDATLAGGVHTETLRLQHLVDDLLLLARMDEGTPGPCHETVDLDDLALAEAARLRTTTDLTVDTTGIGPARTSGNAEQLARAVRNLVDNAVRHGHRSVALATRTVGDTAILQVADDGPGIAPEDRARVFERFVRLDDARARDHGGAGLGLAIVRRIARAHQGEVVLDERPGGGARFGLRLPAGGQGGPDDASRGPEPDAGAPLGGEAPW